VSPPPLEIRRATAGDAPPLAEFAARAFVDAYGPANAPADVALHLARTYGIERQADELAAKDIRCLLALEAGAIVGYACLCEGSRHPAIEAPAPCEVRRFYVDGARHGRGVAAALMDAAVAAARAAGARTLWLTTWERSARARGFYAKHGFADVGATTFMLGASPQTDRLLVRRLDERPAA
jgi:GNAT superfamily N-acetyltransferase